MPLHSTVERIVCSGVKKEQVALMNGLDYAFHLENWLWQISHSAWRRGEAFLEGRNAGRVS
jgi:hypothetical protein